MEPLRSVDGSEMVDKIDAVWILNHLIRIRITSILFNEDNTVFNQVKVLFLSSPAIVQDDDFMFLFH